MGLETVKPTDKPDVLNADWPLGSDDFKYGDDHIRAIKTVLKNFFEDYKFKVDERMFPQFTFDERPVDPDAPDGEKYWHGVVRDSKLLDGDDRAYWESAKSIKTDEFIPEVLPDSTLDKKGAVQVTDRFDMPFKEPDDPDYEPPVTDPDDPKYVPLKALSELGAAKMGKQIAERTPAENPYMGKFHSVWTGDATVVTNDWGTDKLFLVHMDVNFLNESTKNSFVVYVSGTGRKSLETVGASYAFVADDKEFSAESTKNKFTEIFVMAVEDPNPKKGGN